MTPIVAQLLLAIVFMAAGMGNLASARLPDQQGGSDSLEQHRGRVVVAIVMDARRFGAVRRWAEELIISVPAAQVLMVADVNESRPVSLDRVAAVLARRVPEQARVLIDMDRLWSSSLGLDTAVPNVLVIGPDGDLQASYRGRWSDQLARDVRASIVAAGLPP
jgi:hypothetical protein